LKNTSTRSIIDALAPLLFLLVLAVVLAVLKPTFRSTGNLLSMINQSAVIITIAIGQTMLMIAGGIDLSVGSVVALSCVIAGTLHGIGAPPAVGALAAIATATLTGLINGLITTKARMPAFIVTLGMMGIARGATLVISGALALPIPEVYAKLGNHTWFFALVLGLVALCAYLVLTKTPYGRHNYAVGGNKEATRLSGVDVDKHLIKAFVVNGFILGIASILLMARVGAVADPNAGEGFELDSIAAAVIGGTSLLGGQGTVGGSLIGAVIMVVLRNGCNQYSNVISVNWQSIVVGTMIILAVFYDGLRRRSRSKG